MAEKYDVGGWYGGFDGGYMGGPAANNSLGGGYQFTLNDRIWLDHLEINARTWDTTTPGDREFTFDWKLYSGTVKRDIFDVPDPQSALVASQMTVKTNRDPLEYRQYEGVVVPIGQELQPGTYWLTREREFGQSGPIVDSISQRFVGDKLASIHNPEPATAVLIGGGLLAMLRRKRREYLKE